jgi:hypothetical protein
MLSALLIYAAGVIWGRPLLDCTVPQRHRAALGGWLEQGEGAFPLLAVLAGWGSPGAGGGDGPDVGHPNLTRRG